jgi:hypothetical protein
VLRLLAVFALTKWRLDHGRMLLMSATRPTWPTTMLIGAGARTALIP